MKNVVIIGAGSSIAEATAEILAQQGVNLLLCARQQTALDILQQDLRLRYPKIVVNTLLFDALNFDAEIFMSQVLTRMPEIDAVLVAHGILTHEAEAQKNLVYRHQSLQINALSVIDLCEAFAAYFSKRYHGAIAVISSVAGDRGRKKNCFYGTSKGLLNVYLSALRNRLTQWGVHVLTIKPGFVDTPMTKDFAKGLLWASPEQIGRGIVRALQKQRDVVYLPWFWRYIMVVIKLIPERVFKKLNL
jgi:short-subunit dehydrogenase